MKSVILSSEAIPGFASESNPFFATMIWFPASLKMIWLKAPKGPDGGVVSFAFNILNELSIGVRPVFLLTLKHLYVVILWIGRMSWNKLKAYFIPLIAPPFNTQTWSPLLLKASEIGNSPPLSTGCPIAVSCDGVCWLISKRETVFDPAFTPAQNVLWENEEYKGGLKTDIYDREQVLGGRY